MVLTRPAPPLPHIITSHHAHLPERAVFPVVVAHRGLVLLLMCKAVCGPLAATAIPALSTRTLVILLRLTPFPSCRLRSHWHVATWPETHDDLEEWGSMRVGVVWLVGGDTCTYVAIA